MASTVVLNRCHVGVVVAYWCGEGSHGATKPNSSLLMAI